MLAAVHSAARTARAAETMVLRSALSLSVVWRIWPLRSVAGANRLLPKRRVRSFRKPQIRPSESISVGRVLASIARHVGPEVEDIDVHAAPHVAKLV